MFIKNSVVVTISCKKQHMRYFYFCSSINDNLALTLNYKLNIDFRLLDGYRKNRNYLQDPKSPIVDSVNNSNNKNCDGNFPTSNFLLNVLLGPKQHDIVVFPKY